MYHPNKISGKIYSTIGTAASNENIRDFFPPLRAISECNEIYSVFLKAIKTSQTSKYGIILYLAWSAIERELIHLKGKT